jgi:flavodoxin
MKTLIVYYSYSHNNEILAKYLQQKLSCDILKIEEQSKRWGISILLDLVFQRIPRLKEHGISLDLYEHIIFLAPIWGGKIASPLSSFLMKEKSHIRSYSFISICGGANGQAEKIFGELKEISGLKPSNVKELWVNNLLPADKKDTIKNTSGYRIVPADLQKFRNEIDEFLRKVEQPAFSPK